jgi:hypothetical protein
VTDLQVDSSGDCAAAVAAQQSGENERGRNEGTLQRAGTKGVPGSTACGILKRVLDALSPTYSTDRTTSDRACTSRISRRHGQHYTPLTQKYTNVGFYLSPAVATSIASKSPPLRMSPDHVLASVWFLLVVQKRALMTYFDAELTLV